MLYCTNYIIEYWPTPPHPPLTNSFERGRENFKNNGLKGDMIINFEIIFPDFIDSQRTDLLKKLLPKRKNDNGKLENLTQYNITKCDSDYIDHTEFTTDEFEQNQIPGGPECVQQ